jgi:hypothetical protein
MSPMSATRISLIRPPHPTTVEEAAALPYAMAQHSITVATLRGMRTKAHRASQATEALRPISAWDCVGVVPPTHRLRIVGGRSLYRQAFYDAVGSENVRLVRDEPRGDDVHQISRYVTPDTRVELVRNGTVEPDPWVVLTARRKR